MITHKHEPENKPELVFTEGEQKDNLKAIFSDIAAIESRSAENAISHSIFFTGGLHTADKLTFAIAYLSRELEKVNSRLYALEAENAKLKEQVNWCPYSRNTETVQEIKPA